MGLLYIENLLKVFCAQMTIYIGIFGISLLQSPPSKEDAPKASKGTSMCKDLLSIKRPIEGFLCLKDLSETLYAQNFRNSSIYLRAFGGLLCRGILEEVFPVKRGLVVLVFYLLKTSVMFPIH